MTREEMKEIEDAIIASQAREAGEDLTNAIAIFTTICFAIIIAYLFCKGIDKIASKKYCLGFMYFVSAIMMFILTIVVGKYILFV